jgi:hypothetical protein
MVSVSDFLAYDKDNPQVWTVFEKFAKQVVDTGREYFGAKAVMERVRWFSVVEANDTFKVNNNWVAFYARKFGLKYPKHADFFRIRDSAADLLASDHFDDDWKPIVVASTTWGI